MYENHVGRAYLHAPLGAFFFFIALGIFGYLVTMDPKVPLLMALFGSSVPISIWYRDNIRSPRKIDIREEGILAVYWNGSTQFIPWQRFRSIAYWPGDPTKHGLAKISRGDYILEDSTFPYLLDKQLAEEVREAYARRMGKYPPMR